MNLKLCRSCAGSPVDERMERAAAATAVPSYRAAPLADLSYASPTYSRQTHHVNNMSFVHENKSEHTNFIFPQA